MIFICQKKKQKPDFKKVIPFSEGNKQFFRWLCSNLDESFALKFWSSSKQIIAEPIFTCAKLTIETLEQGVNSDATLDDQLLLRFRQI